MPSQNRQPVSINLHKISRILSISFDETKNFDFTCEFLRVHSPSAEVKGHGPGQEVLQTNKENISITNIEPVGNYGIKPYFDDGHDTGIFSWEYLYELGSKMDEKWNEYLDSIKEAGYERNNSD